MPKELTDIVLDEVSIVIEPANEDARVEIVKSKQPIRKENTMAAEHNDDVEDVTDDFDLEDIDEETVAELKAEYDDMDEEERFGAFVAMAAGLEEAGDTITKMHELAVEQDDVLKGVVEEHEELKKSAALLVERVEKRLSGEKGDGEDDIVSVLKSKLGENLDPATERRVVALEAVAKAAEDREAIDKAKAIGVGKPEELAPVLQRVRKANAKDADYLETLLKQNAAVIKKSGLFQTHGAAGVEADSAIAKAKAGAAEIKKANAGLSDAQALTRFFDENPEAYEAYRAETRAA